MGDGPRDAGLERTASLFAFGPRDAGVERTASLVGDVLKNAGLERTASYVCAAHHVLRHEDAVISVATPWLP